PSWTKAVDVTAVIWGEPEATVVERRSEATSLMPCAAASSATTTSMGAALENWLARREPVTTTTSPPPPASVCGSAGCVVSTVCPGSGVCWASAGTPKTPTNAPTATDPLSRAANDPIFMLQSLHLTLTRPSARSSPNAVGYRLQRVDGLNLKIYLCEERSTQKSNKLPRIFFG